MFVREKEYYPWVDSLKGIGILLVIMGHTCNIIDIYQWIYSFHMPLFFIASGLLFRSHATSDMIKRKIRHLLVPYFFFSLLTFFYWLLIERLLRGDSISPTYAFVNIFIARGGEGNYPQNSVLWFLPCLFLTELLFFIEHKIIARCDLSREKMDIVLIFGNLLLCLIIALCLQSYTFEPVFRLPWTLDVVPFSLLFYTFGYVLRSILRPFTNICSSITLCRRMVGFIIAILCYFILYFFVQETNLHVDLNSLIISDFIYMIIAASLGFAATVILSIAINCSLLRYLGNASLTIMCLHEPIKRVVIQLFASVANVTTDSIRTSIFACIGIVVVTLVICVVINEAFLRICPTVIGRAKSID